jgi:hypothetical protein
VIAKRPGRQARVTCCTSRGHDGGGTLRGRFSARLGRDDAPLRRPGRQRDPGRRPRGPKVGRRLLCCFSVWGSCRRATAALTAASADTLAPIGAVVSNVDAQLLELPDLPDECPTDGTPCDLWRSPSTSQPVRSSSRKKGEFSVVASSPHRIIACIGGGRSRSSSSSSSSCAVEAHRRLSVVSTLLTASCRSRLGLPCCPAAPSNASETPTNGLTMLHLGWPGPFRGCTRKES